MRLLRTAAAVGAAAPIVIAAAGAATAPAGASGPAKHRFVSRADAACQRALVRFESLSHERNRRIALRRGRATFDAMVTTIARLTPPPGDERRVSRLVREYRRFSTALHRLIAAKGENSLAAVAEIALANRRARAASRAYGLRVCARLFG